MTSPHDDFDARLARLKTESPPPADGAARENARIFALEAFDDEMAKKNRKATQGSDEPHRLTSIATLLKRIFTMDRRILAPMTAAALGIVLVPLGYTVYQNGQLPRDIDIFTRTDKQDDLAVNEPEALVDALPSTAPTDGRVTSHTGVRESEGRVARRERAQQQVADLPAPAEEAADQAAPMVTAPVGGLTGLATSRPAPSPAPSQVAGGIVAAKRAPAPLMESEADAVAPPDAVVTEENRDRFEAFANNPLKQVATDPVSTFSIDVDTASYAFMRRSLEEGRMPQADAIRVEELINYFDYDYPPADSASEPFKPTVAVYPSPWTDGKEIIHIGLKGYVPPADQAKPANLVFLIDSSGSMNEPDKLPLLKRSFRLLLDQLKPADTVSIVTYAGSAGTVLEPTPASERAKILNAIERLTPGGSTAGAAGIEEAYRLAAEARLEGGINRVILATDGDFNVGPSSPEALKDYISNKRNEGISLSVLGFGQGNYNDALMQALAQNGNGNAAYIDGFREARKVLVAEVGSTLETIASDVKIQVEFNPATVAEYRLIGYETRALRREDFNNDKIDAGEIGAGHSVTALYEITPVGSRAVAIDPLRYGDGDAGSDAAATRPAGNQDELAFLKMRYKLPGETTSTLITEPIEKSEAKDSIDQVDPDIRFASSVAAFGQKLRGNPELSDMSYPAIRDLAQSGRGQDANGYRAEFLQLIDLADALSKP